MFTNRTLSNGGLTLCIYIISKMWYSQDPDSSELMPPVVPPVNNKISPLGWKSFPWGKNNAENDGTTRKHRPFSWKKTKKRKRFQTYGNELAHEKNWKYMKHTWHMEGQHMEETHATTTGVSENVVYPIVPNGFHDHYPYEKWLFHWEYDPNHTYP